MAENSHISLDDQIKCVEREIGMRKRVYARWVENKRMTQAKADQETAAMQAVLDTLVALKAAAAPNDLFGKPH